MNPPEPISPDSAPPESAASESTIPEAGDLEPAPPTVGAAAPTGPPPFTLLDVLAKRFPESSRTTLREWIAAKRVLIDGRVAVTLRQPMAATASVEVLDRLAARTRVAGTLPFHAVHDDADLLVIDKPAGYITSSGPNDSRATVFDILTEHYAKIDDRIRLGLIHRLDKDASGLIAFSKNDAAYESLKAQFAAKSAGRIYAAIVLGAPDPKQGTIESMLVEFADGTVHETRNAQHGEPAVTHYRTIETRGKHALLEVKLETGRKHQIRAHLSERGLPIAGDETYHPHANQAPRLMLVAVELQIDHPRTGKRLTLKIDPPEAVAAWWEAQRKPTGLRPGKRKK